MAEVAASIRPCHLLSPSDEGPCGSAEYALRSPMLNLLACSFDFVLSCFGFRAFCVTEDLRGLGRASGGRVEDRPGGEFGIIDGRSCCVRGD